MTSTTRTLTFRHEPGGNILFRATTDKMSPGLPLAVTTDNADFPTWSMLDGDAVEELHELTGLILKGRERIYPADGDDYLVCTARSENGLYLCCLQRDHSPVLEATPHMDRRGIAFVEPTLPF